MTLLLPYAAVAAVFLVWFIISRGLFKASAAKLMELVPGLKDYTNQEILAKALMIILAADLMGAAATFQTISEDTAAKGYLIRNEYGSGDEEALLSVNTKGETKDVDLVVRARQMSREEIENALAEAEKLLWPAVLGSNDPEHVDGDLAFPETLPGSPVSIAWMTDRPDLIDFDGHLTREIPESGSEVLLSAEIACEEEMLEVERTVTVFPRVLSAEEAWQESIDRAVADGNQETEQKVMLPAEIDGQEASWKLRTDNTGILLLFVGILTAVMFVYSRVRLSEIAETERAEQMVRDYPNLINKLMLLVSAGLSMRKAFDRIRRDYLAGVEAGNPRRPGYEEIVRVSQELEHGLSEAEAYAAMGKRSRPAEYKTFSVLLVQSTMKGGSELTDILFQEAREAYEERKKRARVLGEEAGTKLLLPMVLMLGIVMAILMVPAFLTFA